MFISFPNIHILFLFLAILNFFKEIFNRISCGSCSYSYTSIANSHVDLKIGWAFRKRWNLPGNLDNRGNTIWKWQFFSICHSFRNLSLFYWFWRMLFYLHVSKLNVSMKYHLVKKVGWFFQNIQKVSFLREESSSRVNSILSQMSVFFYYFRIL